MSNQSILNFRGGGRAVKQVRALMGPVNVFQKDIGWPIWVLGLLGYLLLVWFAFAVVGNREHGIPAKLEEAAQHALDRAGVSWASVKADGQAVVLTGAAPSDSARKLAINVVKTAVGPGGFFRGGVTTVRDKTTRGQAAAAPMRWLAQRRDDGALVLSGLAPSVVRRGDLVQDAQNLVPAQIVDSMRPEANAPQDDWLPAARLGLKLIAQMPDGEAEITGRRLTVRGTAPNEAFAQSALAQLRSLPEPFKGESAITAKMNIAELRGTDLAAGERSQANCQDAFTKIMASNTINFEIGAAALSGDNKSVLDKVAYVSKRCSHFHIDVLGHTDSSGLREANIDLSRARANTVVAYLVSQGVSADRLSAQGLGPDKPVASNDTPEGMAKNRRIDFVVQVDGDQ
jgi:OmpA-OmpF porin, OOP family